MRVLRLHLSIFSGEPRGRHLIKIPSIDVAPTCSTFVHAQLVTRITLEHPKKPKSATVLRISCKAKFESWEIRAASFPRCNRSIRPISHELLATSDDNTNDVNVPFYLTVTQNAPRNLIITRCTFNDTFPTSRPACIADFCCHKFL